MSTLTYFSQLYLKASVTRNDTEIDFEKNMTYHLSAVLYWRQLCVCSVYFSMYAKCTRAVFDPCMSYMCVPAIWCCTYLFISCSYEVPSVHLTWDVKSRQLGELSFMKERKRKEEERYKKRGRNRLQTLQKRWMVGCNFGHFWPSPFNPWWYITS